MKSLRIAILLVLLAGAAALLAYFLVKKTRHVFQEPLVLSSGWQLQDVAKVPQPGTELSLPGFRSDGWYPATVPGTVLTSYLNAGAIPDPNFGDNQLFISDSYFYSDFWYRTEFLSPNVTAGELQWLEFEGINWKANVFLNGDRLGRIEGAFQRARYNVTGKLKAGRGRMRLIVLIEQERERLAAQLQKTFANVPGRERWRHLAMPTIRLFIASIGWDWIPRHSRPQHGDLEFGKVFLTTTAVAGPHQRSGAGDERSAAAKTLDTGQRCTVQTTMQTVSNQLRQKSGLWSSCIADVWRSSKRNKRWSLAAQENGSSVVGRSPRLASRQLAITSTVRSCGGPTGYGPQPYLYERTDERSNPMDWLCIRSQLDIQIGIRKVTYFVADSENLTLSVNGVRIYCRGGDWGMDDAMKRIPRKRLGAQIRMHQLANLNMIRNWVGQSTSEDFYELCDQYGILLWDEFFQPNPSDGPNPTDLATYMANVTDKILRFRNHPSVVVWCGRNEGPPPTEIDRAIREVMHELEPVRLYQPSSTDGRGVHSGGPYRWRTPREFYKFNEPFKTEIGSVSIPTLESIHGMMPEKDWETINDDWAEHDLARGAQGGDSYPQVIARRYGKIANLADFARKGQLANYEAFRAMYEGREAKLFQPSTGVITWMSHPAQPSFVWQLYHYDLEPNASLFAVQKACEPVHIQLNEVDRTIQVINHLAAPLTKAQAHLAVYHLDGSKAYEHDFAVEAAPSAATTLEPAAWPEILSRVYFVQLRLQDAQGKLVSENFYWRGIPGHEDELQSLESLPVTNLNVRTTRHDADGKCLLDVTLENPTDRVALMAHVQLRRLASGERVLPVYYSSNYLSFAPHETKTLTVEAALADLQGEKPLLVLDGWNVGVNAVTSAEVDVELNKQAQVASWPTTGLGGL